MSELPRLSRSLLFPGPLAPLSHGGVTLQRHVVTTALRYAFYQLGLPMPESPPVRIVTLRLYLDREPLVELLEGREEAPALLGALLDPGARAPGGRLPMSLRSALAVHSLRLRLRRFVVPRLPEPRADTAADELAAAVRERLRPLQALLGDALLAELAGVLTRRPDRAGGDGVVGPQARRYLLDRSCDPRCLGIPDPLLPSWEEKRPDAEDGGVAAPGSGPRRRRPRRRGVFRETYRAVLSELRPSYLELGRRAQAAGLIDEVDDVFFLPFDLLTDLAGEERPAWLPRAVASNRLEYEAALVGTGPPQILEAVERQSWPSVSRPAQWSRACLAPLP